MLSFASYCSHPGCTCPQGYEGPHCEFLSGERPKPDVDIYGTEDGAGKSRDGLSTAGIVLLVLLADLLILGSIGAFILLKRRRYMRDIEAHYGMPPPNNLMARDRPEPPSMDDILSMESLPDNSERSSMNGSVHSSGRNSYYNGDEDYNSRHDEQRQLVNVAII